jgi:hypothetical protein
MAFAAVISAFSRSIFRCISLATSFSFIVAALHMDRPSVGTVYCVAVSQMRRGEKGLQQRLLPGGKVTDRGVRWVNWVVVGELCGGAEISPDLREVDKAHETFVCSVW